MKNLFELIVEENTQSGCSIGDGFSMEEAIEHLKVLRDNKRANDIPDKFIEEFVNFMYTLWGSGPYNRKQNYIPFRFAAKFTNGMYELKDLKECRIARIYERNASDKIADKLNDLGKKYNVNITVRGADFSISKLKIRWGDGSLFGVRDKKGVDEESEVRNSLISYITILAQKLQRKDTSKLTGNDINNTLKERNALELSKFNNMYLSGVLDDIIERCIQDPMGFADLITLDGRKSTKRNANGELWDKDFNLNKDNTQEILNQSGKIISDVTITTKDPVYISVKMLESQHSGPNCTNIFNNPRILNHFKSSTSYNKVPDGDKKALVNFCDAMGLDPVQLYDIYAGIRPCPDDGILNMKQYDKKSLGILFQKIVGGNYWYCKGDSVTYIPSKVLNWEVELSKASISKQLKTITMTGTIKDRSKTYNIRIVCRTSGGYIYPFRIFPIINIKEVINNIGK